MSNSTAEGRALLLQYAVEDYDRHWLVDHDTTVRRWDEEVTTIVEMGRAVGRPIDGRDVAPWVIHELVHDLIREQQATEGSPIYMASRKSRMRELFQMVALRSLYEIVIWVDLGSPIGEVPGVPWVNCPPCTSAISATRELMVSKNRQYGSSWSVLRSSDMTGTIHAKIHRITQLVAGEENTFESIEDNYRDILNYAIFCLIRLSMESDKVTYTYPAGEAEPAVPDEEALAAAGHILDREKFTEGWLDALDRVKVGSREGLAELQDRLAEMASETEAVVGDGVQEIKTTWSLNCKPIVPQKIDRNAAPASEADIVELQRKLAEMANDPLLNVVTHSPLADSQILADAKMDGALPDAMGEAVVGVLMEIAVERRRQERMWGTGFDERNTINDWISHVCRYAAGADGFIGGIFYPNNFRAKMIKAAAIAVAAIETFDRMDGKMAPRHYDVED